ncbi:MAG: hypothetical protein HYX55_06665 [Chloroflexi bacterium]|nr:hypothetical protein [Chloroflexota bacterium]
MRRAPVALLLSLLGVAGAPPATAEAASAPLKTVSRYMTTLNSSTLYDEGCAQGTKAWQTFAAQSLVVVLDFGTPVKFTDGSWGASMWGAPNQRTSAIRDAVKWYATGFHQCSAEDNSDQLRLAVGTSNDGSAVAATSGADAHGRAWATMINELQAWVAGRSEGQTVSFAGANDIEPGFGDPDDARAWVKGYDAVTNWQLYDFGSADGCSSTAITSYECGTSAHPAWSAEDLWFVSWGASVAWPLPEIYVNPPPGNPIQAKQWYWVSKYSVAVHGSRLLFKGAFTEYAADSSTNTAAQGWTQLYTQVNADSSTATTPAWSTDITWAN